MGGANRRCLHRRSTGRPRPTGRLHSRSYSPLCGRNAELLLATLRSRLARCASSWIPPACDLHPEHRAWNVAAGSRLAPGRICARPLMALPVQAARRRQSDARQAAMGGVLTVATIRPGPTSGGIKDGYQWDGDPMLCPSCGRSRSCECEVEKTTLTTGNEASTGDRPMTKTLRWIWAAGVAANLFASAVSGGFAARSFAFVAGVALTILLLELGPRHRISSLSGSGRQRRASRSADLCA